jgi:hypothetical protein
MCICMSLRLWPVDELRPTAHEALYTLLQIFLSKPNSQPSETPPLLFPAPATSGKIISDSEEGDILRAAAYRPAERDSSKTTCFDTGLRLRLELDSIGVQELVPYHGPEWARCVAIVSFRLDA